MSMWRDAHRFQAEPLEYRRLRLRAQAEEPEPGEDLTLPTDRLDELAPAYTIPPAHVPAALLPCAAGATGTAAERVGTRARPHPDQEAA